MCVKALKVKKELALLIYAGGSRAGMYRPLFPPFRIEMRSSFYFKATLVYEKIPAKVMPFPSASAFSLCKVLISNMPN